MNQDVDVVEAHPPAPSEDDVLPDGCVSPALTTRLYVSHFLSTWNSRLFEAAAVYFLASIFHNSLLPVSIYALMRNGAVVLLTAPVGWWIDKGNRLAVVQTSIVGQRLSIATSCGLFWVLIWRSDAMAYAEMHGLFASTLR